MATTKYRAPSPYAKDRQKAHVTDFKHQRYLESIGFDPSMKKDEVLIQEDLKVINVALFGLGRAGSIHLANIMRNTRICLKYVVEEDHQRMKCVQAKWHLPDNVLLFPEESEKVFRDPSVHGIIIATPTFTHKDLIVQGLNAEKAVFCEKPIAEEYESVRHCYELAKKVDKPLLCAFNRRFDPSFSHLRDQVHSGVVGQVHMVKTVARDSPPAPVDYLKISGGILHDCAVHDVDLICWVLGEYPTHVFASGTAFIPEVAEINDQDTVAITMRFPSGAISMTDLSRNAVYGYDQRLEVFGPKGMMIAGNERPYNVTTSTEQGKSEPPLFYSFPSRYCDGYIKELDHFCDIIQGLDEISISGDNTLRISTIISALEVSNATGKMTEVKY
ncbi:myo-inositol 2-dehydrogenase-like isoform X2 [Panulirus ornatus]|uniref:myo-inositol 2-dehydrogenase-like isoform X2 n=1 Tax=Panulirus ornatus TaxID=150431 RepID=UPI003A8A9556